MKRRNVLESLIATMIVAFLALGSCTIAWAKEDVAIPKTAEHGIPMLIITIDESDEGLEAIRKDDPDHTYGTIADMNASEDHTTRCIGNVRFLMPDDYLGEYGSSLVPEGDVELKFIRGRGKSSWSLGLKKPYRIQLQEPFDLFGMGESVSWTLISNETEPTLLRNRIAYWLGDEIGLSFTPQQIPLDIYIVGSESGTNYLGSYTLCEPVRFEKGRMEVPELDEDMVDDTTITGGYLLSIFSPQDEGTPDSTMIRTDSGIEMLCEYPEFTTNDLTEGEEKQRSYIRNYLNKIDSLIMSPGDIDKKKHMQISALMDLRSTADYWWVQEFSANYDAYQTSSTYLYKTRDEGGVKGKLFWGPLWDFDMAWLVDEDTDFGSAKGFNNTEFPWLDRLREMDSFFVNLLEERWQDPVNGVNLKLQELTRKGGQLDRYRDEIKASWEADMDRWSDDPVSSKVDVDDKASSKTPTEELQDFDEIIERLRDWIDQRRTWINEHLDELDEVHYTMTYKVDGEEYQQMYARGDGYLAYPPEAPKKDGMVFAGWKEEVSGTDAIGFRPTQDTTFEATYMSEDDVVLPKGVFFSRKECWDHLDIGEYNMNPLVTYPENATREVIRWTSSNEDVAAVAADGRPRIVGAGDVTITALFPNGMRSSYILHVLEPERLSNRESTGFEVPEEPLRVEVGKAAQFDVYLLPKQTPLAHTPLTCTTDDSLIARVVDGNACVIEGMKPGKTNITILALDSNGKTKFKATREVEVVEAGRLPQGSDRGLFGVLSSGATPWILALGAIAAVAAVLKHRTRPQKPAESE